MDYRKSSNSKRIAQNTLMLYLRMFLILGVSLFTSRVVLQTLGVSDYGIYSVVGGFVSMLAYLNAVFVGATQRFMSFALGKNDKSVLSDTFATANISHIIIALIILVVAETFGLWFVNNKLVIDAGRMIAANWVYQCSILSLLITIITIPYNACIVAHEHMHVYAYVSILDVVLKLVILYLLVILSGDKLIVYALLHVVISFVVCLCYTAYCRKNFEECRVRLSGNKKLLKEMTSFAGWTALGSLGFTFKDQFSNIILNFFWGTTINAARGIAIQVNSAVNSFATNFFMAISPQITKQYASGNLEQSQKLVYAGSRYSFYLLSLITIPVIININYILKIWLGTVPNYTASFLIITLISSLIYSLSNPTTTALQATGNIKIFQIGVSVILLLELPAAYVILKFGYPPDYSLLPAIVTNTVALVFRFHLLKKMIPSYSLKVYYLHNVLRCLIIFVVCFVPCVLFKSILSDSFYGLCVSVVVSLIIIGLIVFFAGINKGERQMLIGYIKSKRTRR